MRAVIQRVSEASVSVVNAKVGEIGAGLVVVLGVGEGDCEEDANWLINKISALRIFSDIEGKMNKSLVQIEGEILVISQFTLFASTKKGNRPSFVAAEKPERAEELYKYFVIEFEKVSDIKPQTGIFAADMKVSLVNDGPVTIFMDTKNKE